jgi:hypothetical protein
LITIAEKFENTHAACVGCDNGFIGPNRDVPKVDCHLYICSLDITGGIYFMEAIFINVIF